MEIELDKALSLLQKEGFNVCNYSIIKNVKDIHELNLKYPVVLKVSSSKYSHKSDVGGVIANIQSQAELERLYTKESIRLDEPKWIVQEMVRGIELIIGTSLDPTFGEILMFGIGGIYAELLKDVSYRKIPIDESNAENMMNELKLSPILNGYRNIKISKESIKDLLMKTSAFVKKYNITGMDLNPVICNEKSCYIVDVRVSTDTPPLQ
ncbi:MAG: acetate--CoA ligase family protein [Thermoplasmata archaeon]